MDTAVNLQLSVQDLLMWLLVGLIAGFLASRVMLGSGLGVLGDVVIGILGAILGSLISVWLGIAIVIQGHQTVSRIIMAFVGALVLLLILRLVGLGRRRRTAL